MANTYVPVDLDIGSNRTVLINVRSDVAEYFGIAASENPNDVVVTRRRKAHKRNNYDGASDATSETEINVEASEWETYRRVAKVGSGKKVRIPTKLKGRNDNVRYTSIRFPGNATVGAIGNFLFEKCDQAKRPPFFIMESGTKYPVADITGDVNKGEGDTTSNPDP